MSTKKQSLTFIIPFGHSLLQEPLKAGAGGAERQFYLFGKSLKSRGWDISYICSNDGGNTTKQFPVYHCSFKYLGGSKLRIPFDWLTLFYAMWKSNSEYYVIKTPGHLLAPMSIFAKIFNKKIVFWAQMEYDAYPHLRTLGLFVGKLQDYGVARTELIIAQNKSQVEGFKTSYNKTAHLVKNIIGSFGILQVEPVSSEFLTDVLWVGNSLEKKRYEVVISLAKLMPNTKFTIAMNCSNELRYNEASVASRLLDNVMFLGQVSPDIMDLWYKKTKILFSSSTQEGFPNTFLQSWQVGKPVISLAVDPDDVIKVHNLGLVLEQEINQKQLFDFDLLAKLVKPIIEKGLHDTFFYKKASQNALEYVKDNHGEDIVLTQLINHLITSK